MQQQLTAHKSETIPAIINESCGGRLSPSILQKSLSSTWPQFVKLLLITNNSFLLSILVIRTAATDGPQQQNYPSSNQRITVVCHLRKSLSSRCPYFVKLLFVRALGQSGHCPTHAPPSLLGWLVDPHQVPPCVPYVRHTAANCDTYHTEAMLVHRLAVESHTALSERYYIRLFEWPHLTTCNNVRDDE